jgi:hypothetical protein
VLALVMVWSFTDLAWLWLNRHGWVVVGVDGPFASDELQYVSWVRESGQHLLVNNLYAGSVQHAWFLHPMFLISGALWRLGVPLSVALQVWKPVAAVGLVLSYGIVVRRLLESEGARTAALLLALFSASPLLVLTAWGSFSSSGLNTVAGAAYAAGQLWGYLPTACALALLAFALVSFATAIDGATAAPARIHAQWTAIGAAVLASWLHPWEGTIGLLVVGAVGLWTVREQRSSTAVRATAFVGAGFAVPLVYYLALNHEVAAWKVANHAVGATPSLPWLLVVLAPFMALALFAGWWPDRPLERIVRVWAVVAIAASLVLGTTVPSHFLASVGLPLSVLAVEGWRRQRLWRASTARAIAGAILVSLAIVPGTAAIAKITFDLQRARTQPHLITHDEDRAFAWLDDAPRGVVLASTRLATAVPALTGLPTWFGHPNWTPDYATRATRANALFAGTLSATEERAVVAESAARYLLADCSSHLDPASVAPGARVVTFGCVRVVVL